MGCSQDERHLVSGEESGCRAHAADVHVLLLRLMATLWRPCGRWSESQQKAWGMATYEEQPLEVCVLHPVMVVAIQSLGHCGPVDTVIFCGDNLLARSTCPGP